jgi:chromosome segregation ATPase
VPTLRDYQALVAAYKKLQEELEKLRVQEQPVTIPENAAPAGPDEEPAEFDQNAEVDAAAHAEIMTKLAAITAMQQIYDTKLANLTATVLKAHGDDGSEATKHLEAVAKRLEIAIQQQQSGLSPEALEKLEKIQESLTQLEPGINNAAIEGLQQQVNALANVPKSLDLLIAELKDQNNHLANIAVAVDSLGEGQQRSEAALTAIIQNNMSTSAQLGDVSASLQQLEERKPDESKLDSIVTATQRADNGLDQVLKELKNLNKDADAAAERDKELSSSLQAMGLRIQRSEQRVEKLAEESSSPRGKMNLRLWVDPKTGQPVKLEPRP